MTPSTTRTPSAIPTPVRPLLRPVIASAAALCLVGSLAACTAASTATPAATSSATSVAVDAASTDSNTAAVVAAAQALIASLSADQLDAVSFDYSDLTAKENWSNLPEGMVSRGGLQMADLSDEQKTLVFALLDAMLSDDGYQHVLDTMAADDILATQGGGGLTWGSGYYFLSIYGTPSVDSAFGIGFGGHHLAINADYQGDVVSVTPEFMGIEPQEFTASDGSTVEAMATQKSAVFAVLDSLSADELAAAELPLIYDDVVMGPGQDSGSFPTETGVLVSSLTQEQQDLVTAAIRAWVGILDDSVADPIVASYVAAYYQTTVMWSGSTDPESADVYFRISGPAVWIEYVHQNGIGFAGIHLHTVYRDKTSDYGL